MKNVLGIIGKNIAYSYSKSYFEDKFKKQNITHCDYRVFDLQEIEEVDNVFAIENLIGFNVTIPYKEKIIDFLDDLSPEAKAIGAVNCVVIQNGKKIGYNTDAFGFEKTLRIHKKENHQSALVLGNGGAAKAVRYVLELHGIPHQMVARKHTLNFENLTSELVAEHKIIIQTTPVGTYPNIDECLEFPFDALGREHLVIDLIYNPNYTKFIQNSAKNFAKTANGLYMLEQQAEKAWEIWNIMKK